MGRTDVRSQIVDGSAVARRVREEVARGAALVAASGQPPGLATLLIGDDQLLLFTTFP
jgi:methylenetetrahydrofolate dehydrogenase (NADP+)/methenyltetrahydrofolate cyclohydrolase